MATIGTIARAVLVGLSTLMTTVAGIPHFDCRCPNGDVKPFCFGLSSGRSGCCCAVRGGTCCCHVRRSPSAARAKKAPCCARGPGQSKSEPAPHGQSVVDANGCAKRLADPVTLAFTAKPTPSVYLLADVGLPLQAVLVSSATSGAPGQPFGQAHLSAPPPDLLTLLQRLLL
jgi:hypothetical protein